MTKSIYSGLTLVMCISALSGCSFSGPEWSGVHADPPRLSEPDREDGDNQPDQPTFTPHTPTVEAPVII